jgi:hypothetical protein
MDGREEKKTASLFLSAFRTLVPSLSWQMFRSVVLNGIEWHRNKRRFSFFRSYLGYHRVEKFCGDRLAEMAASAIRPRERGVFADLHKLHGRTPGGVGADQRHNTILKVDMPSLDQLSGVPTHDRPHHLQKRVLF